MRKSINQNNVDHSITIVIVAFVLLLFSVLQISAQEINKKDKNDKATKSVKTPNSTQATGDKTSFKDENGNLLMEVTDEGAAGSIKLNDAGAVTPSTNKLYNNGGNLYWNGSALGSGGGASQLNDLSDAKTNFSSIFLGNGAGENDDNGASDGVTNSNTAIGINALKTNTTGIKNVAVGLGADYYNQIGSFNTMIGYQAGRATSTHSKNGNVFLGYKAGYYETGNNKLYINNDSSSTPLIWGDFANGSEQVKINGNFHVTGNITSDGTTTPDNDWDVNGNELLLFNPVSQFVGIGTNITETLTKLHVRGDEGVLFQGTFGNGNALSLGAGTRFHFYPKKSAIRGGHANSTQWDDANIGNYSTAFGLNSKSSGLYSAAIGNNAQATNDAAFATGAQTVASGKWSTAMGANTDATGNYSTALGSATNANSYMSTALGSKNIGGGSATTWVSTDPIFEIGNGETTASNAMTVLKNGKVGIGTNNPIFNLVINSGAGTTASQMMFKNDDTGDSGFRVGINSNEQADLSLAQNKAMRFLTNNTLRMFISGTGDIGIGTQNPSEKLDVNGNVNVNGNVKMNDAEMATAKISGTLIKDFIKLSGSTNSDSQTSTDIPYPPGFTKENTHILSCKVLRGEPSLQWYNIGYFQTSDSENHSLHVTLFNSAIRLWLPDNAFESKPYEIVIMRID